MNTLSADQVKACCATAYGGPIATYLLGENFHPGGEQLTRRLLGQLSLTPEHLLVDVASGRGASAMLAAAQTGCQVVGVDLAVVEYAGVDLDRAERKRVEAQVLELCQPAHGIKTASHVRTIAREYPSARTVNYLLATKAKLSRLVVSEVDERLVEVEPVHIDNQCARFAVLLMVALQLGE